MCRGPGLSHGGQTFISSLWSVIGCLLLWGCVIWEKGLSVPDADPEGADNWSLSVESTPSCWVNKSFHEGASQSKYLSAIHGFLIMTQIYLYHGCSPKLPYKLFNISIFMFYAFQPYHVILPPVCS